MPPTRPHSSSAAEEGCEDEQQGEGGFDENELEHDDEDEPLFQVDAEGLGDGGEAARMM